MNDMDLFNEKIKEIHATLEQIRNNMIDRFRLEKQLQKVIDELKEGKLKTNDSLN